MLKLMYISTARIPSEKAHPYQILQMCDAFTEHNVEVELLHPYRENTPAMAAASDVGEYYGLRPRFALVTLPTLDILHRTEHVLASFPSLLFRVGQRFAFNLLIATYARSVLRYLRHHAADVYYLRDMQILWALCRARPDLASRIVYEAHMFPKAAMDQQKVRVALPQVSGVVTVTHHLKRLYTQAGIQPEKVLVAPDSVDLRRFERVKMDRREARLYLNLPPECFMVGYVGRLRALGQERGVGCLVEAMAMLKGTAPSLGVAMCCVGGPEEAALQYQALADQLGLTAEQTIFVPQIPPVIVPLYLCAFDVCVMPFPWTQHYAYYVSPLKLFEYMAAQRPIVATELPSVQEVLRHDYNAYLVPPDNPQALAEGILWLATHPEAAQSLARQARADVEQYTWPKRAERVLAFLSRSSHSDLQEIAA